MINRFHPEAIAFQNENITVVIALMAIFPIRNKKFLLHIITLRQHFLKRCAESGKPCLEKRFY